jgi:hypothetical protein
VEVSVPCAGCCWLQAASHAAAKIAIHFFMRAPIDVLQLVLVGGQGATLTQVSRGVDRQLRGKKSFA